MLIMKALTRCIILAIYTTTAASFVSDPLANGSFNWDTLECLSLSLTYFTLVPTLLRRQDTLHKQHFIFIAKIQSQQYSLSCAIMQSFCLSYSCLFSSRNDPPTTTRHHTWPGAQSDKDCDACLMPQECSWSELFSSSRLEG